VVLKIFSTTPPWLPDVLECHGLSLNLLSKLVVSLILEKHFVVLEYFPASLKLLEQLFKLFIIELLITLNIQVLRSEIPRGMSAKLRTVAASKNRVHMP